METCFIALGKVGDVLSVLPILQHEAESNGHKPKLLVSRDYAHILNRVSYVEPLVYAGEFGDLSGAIKLLKRQGKQAIPLQVYGKDMPFRKMTPSFQLDQWLRAGAVAHFQHWPLTLDRRDKHMERALVKDTTGHRPFILFADFSESSPFPEANALASSLQTRFGDTHDLIRLSGVRAQHFCDFVGLYHRASLLVTIETAHLHLSRAVNTPVVAIVTDKPSRWHGSAWHPRMVFQCRYSNFKLREMEMMQQVRRVLNGRERHINTVPTKMLHGYNPSIVEGVAAMTYRYHPMETWKTRLAVERDGKMFPISLPEQYDDYSHEDARLFWHKGKIHLSFVIANNELGRWSCIVAYGEVVEADNGSWSVPDVIVPEWGQNNFGSTEKNWVFMERDGRLFCIYSSKPEQVVIELQRNRVTKAHRCEGPEWLYGEIRGGCVIPHGSKLLRFFHSHTTEGHRSGWVYSIGAAVMDARPPFKTIAISQSPIVSGNEKFSHDCKHWKANVAFPGGVTREDNGWRLIYGSNDCECTSIHLSESDLNL